MLSILFTAILFLATANAHAACTPTSATEQTCDYVLTWDWTQGAGDPATGFIMQQQVDGNGIWYDIYQPIPVTQKTLTDTIQGDKGGRAISWRVLAYNDVGRSGPSNTASVVTPAIVQADAVVVTTQPGMIVNVSRRASDMTSIISVLVNANETIGPAGVEIAYPVGNALSVSRRATDTSSVVSMLVNKNQAVIHNGQVK